MVASYRLFCFNLNSHLLYLSLYEYEMNDPAVLLLEHTLSRYTGARHVIAMKRCSVAILGACEYLRACKPWPDPSVRNTLFLPRRTYVFIPQILARSGFVVSCTGPDWVGGYRIFPSSVWDYARTLRPNMYRPGEYQCLSFHRSKPLGHTEGGAVLTDDPEADVWLRRWRDDGRDRLRPDLHDMIGFPGLMYPGIAAELRNKLHWFKEEYPEGKILPNSDYPDLSLTDWSRLWRKQQKLPASLLRLDISKSSGA